MQWKKGDWCFCDFKLQQIEEMEKDKVTSVTDGYIIRGGYSINDSCFPLTMLNKIISGEYKLFSKKIHALNMNSLNYPDIASWLESHWVETCKMCEAVDDNNKLIEKRFKELKIFCDDILKRVDEMKKENVHGISLFRR